MVIQRSSQRVQPRLGFDRQPVVLDCRPQLARVHLTDRLQQIGCGVGHILRGEGILLHNRRVRDVERFTRQLLSYVRRFAGFGIAQRVQLCIEALLRCCFHVHDRRLGFDSGNWRLLSLLRLLVTAGARLEHLRFDAVHPHGHLPPPIRMGVLPAAVRLIVLPVAAEAFAVAVPVGARAVHLPCLPLAFVAVPCGKLHRAAAARLAPLPAARVPVAVSPHLRALPVFEPGDAPLPIVAVARGIDRSQLVQRLLDLPELDPLLVPRGLLVHLHLVRALLAQPCHLPRLHRVEALDWIPLRQRHRSSWPRLVDFRSDENGFRLLAALPLPAIEHNQRLPIAVRPFDIADPVVPPLILGHPLLRPHNDVARPLLAVEESSLIRSWRVDQVVGVHLLFGERNDGVPGPGNVAVWLSIEHSVSRNCGEQLVAHAAHLRHGHVVVFHERAESGQLDVFEAGHHKHAAPSVALLAYIDGASLERCHLFILPQLSVVPA